MLVSCFSTYICLGSSKLIFALSKWSDRLSPVHQKRFWKMSGLYWRKKMLAFQGAYHACCSPQHNFISFVIKARQYLKGFQILVCTWRVRTTWLNQVLRPGNDLPSVFTYFPLSKISVLGNRHARSATLGPIEARPHGLLVSLLYSAEPGVIFFFPNC